MDLSLDKQAAQGYSSGSQIARRLTESWLERSGFCPNCGSPLTRVPNNSPVLDFVCHGCHEEYELKSKRAVKLPGRVNDGAYSAMMQKIQSGTLPNFFFMAYTRDWTVRHLIAVPRRLMLPEMVVARPALGPQARRAGWVGCLLDLSALPEVGKVPLVTSGQPQNPAQVQQAWRASVGLGSELRKSDGWLLSLLRCLDTLPDEEFALADAYAFENQLAAAFPDNNNVRPKIRQQLQLLRNLGALDFLGHGRYRWRNRNAAHHR